MTSLFSYGLSILASILLPAHALKAHCVAMVLVSTSLVLAAYSVIPVGKVILGTLANRQEIFVDAFASARVRVIYTVHA